MTRTLTISQEKHYIENYIDAKILDFTYHFIESQYLDNEINYFVMNLIISQIQENRGMETLTN